MHNCKYCWHSCTSQSRNKIWPKMKKDFKDLEGCAICNVTRQEWKHHAEYQQKSSSVCYLCK